MNINHKKNGDRFGCHRVIDPAGALPQPANRLDNDVNALWDNEILVNVSTLNIDSASFTQIKDQAGGDESKIKNIILEIVESKGKMQNPVTGSGGVFIGAIEDVGEKLIGRIDLQKGDRVVSLVSLSLTPLKIFEISDVFLDIDKVDINGKAILFESSIYAKLPEDISESLALSILDVCGAPAQTARLVNAGDTVVIIGAGGKSGILCAYEAKKRVGKAGRVIGIAHSAKSEGNLKQLNLCHDVVRLNAGNALECYEKISGMTNGNLADLVINCVNVPNTELASAMMCRDRGKVYFFSMATSFTKAALGAEGIGKDIDMIIGNGYAKDHAEIALNILRESSEIRELYERIYG